VRTGLSVSHQERKKLTSGKGAPVPPLLAGLGRLSRFRLRHVCLVTGRGRIVDVNGRTVRIHLSKYVAKKTYANPCLHSVSSEAQRKLKHPR
jgi:hypothetical protein